MNKSFSQLIDAALTKYIRQSGAPKLLEDAMAYSLLNGGKRLRPNLCLSCCAMLGGDVEHALPIACATEMIHTYSLIHDDLPCMDDDDMRRGKPSNHKVFGETNAVLSGDGLLTFAFETALKEGLTISSYAPQYYRAVFELAKGAGVTGMVAGQVLDVNQLFEQGDLTALESIQSKKTGALIEAAALSGAIIAGADEEELCAIRVFAQSYGKLFQITDDILDVIGSDDKMGKTLGKDAKENKLTAVTLLGLEGAIAYAKETASQAIAALDIFGEKASALIKLVNDTLIRCK